MFLIKLVNSEKAARNMQGKYKQGKAEVVPSSSLFEIKVEVEVGVEVRVEVEVHLRCNLDAT